MFAITNLKSLGESINGSQERGMYNKIVALNDPWDGSLKLGRLHVS